MCKVHLLCFMSESEIEHKASFSVCDIGHCVSRKMACFYVWTVSWLLSGAYLFRDPFSSRVVYPVLLSLTGLLHTKPKAYALWSASSWHPSPKSGAYCSCAADSTYTCGCWSRSGGSYSPRTGNLVSPHTQFLGSCWDCPFPQTVSSGFSNTCSALACRFPDSPPGLCVGLTVLCPPHSSFHTTTSLYVSSHWLFFCSQNVK